ncbi:MAG: hypothetical protein ACU83N_03350 [Gammaproteobacteria bacterium]
MAVQLTRQQVNEFKSELMSLYMAQQMALVQDNENFYDCADDSELEGCINLLFDLNYVDPENIPEHAK